MREAIREETNDDDFKIINASKKQSRRIENLNTTDSSIKNLRQNLLPRVKNTSTEMYVNLENEVEDTLLTSDKRFSISPLNKLRINFDKSINQTAVRKKLSCAGTIERIGIFAQIFKRSCMTLNKIYSNKNISQFCSPTKKKSIVQITNHKQEEDLDSEISEEDPIDSDDKTRNSTLNMNLSSDEKKVLQYEVNIPKQINSQVKSSQSKFDSEIKIDTPCSSNNINNLEGCIQSNFDVISEEYSSSSNSHATEVNIEDDTEDEKEHLSTMKKISVSNESNIMALYSEEDKFVNELDDEIKKYYISAMENFYGNYNIYVNNSLMLTTTLPSIDYFKHEINKKKLNFNLSPYKKLLVLDLDETLIHTDFDYRFESHMKYLKMYLDDEENTLPINIRPHVFEFLEFSAKYFDIVLFTASCKEYANTIVEYLDPEKKLFKLVLSREHCVVYKNLYLKFLEIFDVPMKDCIIVDNSIYSFAYNLSNGILVTSYYNEEEDIDLLSLKEFLEVVILKAHDVREVIESTFEFEKIRESLRNTSFDELQKLELYKDEM
jgi:Dullard-like phosphatase family protein